MPDEPRPPVQVFSPELSLKLFQLHVFFSLADQGYYNMLLIADQVKRMHQFYEQQSLDYKYCL